jgi:DNA-binding transcriptional regulator YdaS (Cro superfamily)
MESLLAYLNNLPPHERDAFAARCKTSVNYLRSATSAGKKLGDRLVVSIERESGGAVRAEDLRPDIDWAYLRGGPVHGSKVPPRRSSRVLAASKRE